MNTLKFSHILYKTDDLENEIKRFEQKGFQVKIGSGKKPYNAFIYLEQDVFIELFTFNQPDFLVIILRFILNLINPSISERIKKYHTANTGEWCDYCIEASDDNDYTKIITKIKMKGLEIGKEKKFSKKNTNGSKTKWIVNTPVDNKLPFFMGLYTALSNKSKHLLIHDNGIKGIQEIHIESTNIKQSIEDYNKIFDVISLNEHSHYHYIFDNSILVVSKGKKDCISKIIFDNKMVL